jgi:hypothetical protein
MMRRFEREDTLTTQQTRRAANTTRRKIGSSVPEGLGLGARHRLSHCGAVAGKSMHSPMT